MPAKTVIQLRRDTAANWTTANPALASGEIGFETDTGKFKIGDGTTLWSSLTYFNPGSGGSGTVTSITAGTGLSGGTITTSGTIALSHLGIESLADPNADRIMFWDDSAGALAWLTVGSNLSITDTTISSTDTTYSAATSSTLGLTKLFSDTTQTEAANAVSSAVSRTYGIQINGSGQLVVNVPWADTNTTYTAGTGLTLSGTEFSVTANTYQPLDADLTAIAGLAGTSGVLRKTNTDTWTLDTATFYTSVGTDVALADGGTNASLTAVNGGIVYSTASAFAISAAGSSGQILRSGGAGAPTWSTATFPSTATTSGTFLRADGTNWVASSQTLTLSGNTTIGSTTNTVSFATSGNTSVTLPTSGTLATTTGAGAQEQFMTIAVSDETTNLTTGTAKITFRAPFAMTLSQIPRASLATASSSGLVTVDINEGGTSVLGANKLSIDANEKTSTTAATATTLADTSIADDAEITIDIDGAGTGAKGLKVTIFYRRA